MTALTTRRKTITIRAHRESLGDIPLEMTSIPAGSFWMGTPDEEIERLCKEYNRDYFLRESPQHLVNISPFYLGRYPITQAQWREVAGWEKVEIDLDPDPSNFKNDFEEEVEGKTVISSAAQRPVEQVSWLEAKEFCARLSDKTGRNYRLPTEAEWEYACRGICLTDSPLDKGGRGGSITQAEWNQTHHKPFHFGEMISSDYANYRGNGVYGRGSEGKYREQTTPVGLFNVANNFGLSDMHGNVWEWCEDDFHNNYEGAPTDGTAWVSPEDTNTSKVLRGGSWVDIPWVCRSARRLSDSRVSGDFSIGFRVVCSLPEQP